jgi:outer membrane receptor protein involved in Fe transport
MHFAKKILLFLTIAFSIISYGQTTGSGTVKGTVRDTKGEPVPFVTVSTNIKTIGVIADEKGNYTIRNLKPDTYQITAAIIGFKPQTKQITITATAETTLNFELEEAETSLKTITITGKTRAEKLREEAYAVQVVEAESFKNTSTDVNQILNKVSGVNIRQAGGLGSEFSLSLNGLSGKQVKTFINGVPMDYFGSSLTLNNFPANLITGIEIYKGVVPIHLSSDALGGAININTSTKPVDFLDGSYSLGSFNTHRVALNGQLCNNKNGLTVRVKSFFNSSANNYKTDVFLWDSATGKKATQPTEVRRFHDGYNSGMMWLEGGLVNKKWADELMIGALTSYNHKEIQQPDYALGTADIPVGEASKKEEKLIFNFSWKKKNLLNEKLNLAAYLVYVNGNEKLIDTCSDRYDWLGGKLDNIHKTTGEIDRKSLFTLRRNNILSNINAGYELVKNHNLAFNLSLNMLTLQGSDPLHPQKNIQYNVPSDVNKAITALAYTNSLLNNRLKNTLFVKNYNFFIRSLETDYSGTEQKTFATSKNLTGYGLASTYFILENLQAKISFEHALRFPESEEIFGNGQLVRPNPTLRPESSNNYNLGFRYGTLKPIKNKFSIEVNGFVRDAKDFIRVESQGVMSTYVNQLSVLSKGVDVNLQVVRNEKIRLAANCTFQDIRNTNKWHNGVVGNPDYLYGDRIPNLPFLFGSMVLSYNFKSLFAKGDQFSVSSMHNFTNHFYLIWSELASEDKNFIPTQYTTDLEFTWQSEGSRYNASLLCSNILDSKVYDNFSQQKPGRAIAVKVRYFLSSKSN